VFEGNWDMCKNSTLRIVVFSKLEVMRPYQANKAGLTTRKLQLKSNDVQPQWMKYNDMIAEILFMNID